MSLLDSDVQNDSEHKEKTGDVSSMQVLKGIPLLLSLDEPTPALEHFLSACAEAWTTWMPFGEFGRPTADVS